MNPKHLLTAILIALCLTACSVFAVPELTNTEATNIDTAPEKTAWKTALELENVDNTADLDKPLSTATQTALDNQTHVSADIADATSDGKTNPEKVLKSNPAGSLSVTGLTSDSIWSKTQLSVGATGQGYFDPSSLSAPPVSIWTLPNASGTMALTSQADGSITLADITDAGTMAAQDATSVAITGGTIAGVEIAAPLFIMGSGQSNMYGPTTATTIGSDKVFVWNGTTWLTNGATGVLGAMVIRMAERIAETEGRSVYCVMDGLGGEPISGWVGSGASSARYVALKAKVESALASAELTGISKSAPDCFVWMQGEADSNSLTYIADFQTLISQLDAETWYDARATPVLIPKVVESALSAKRILKVQSEIPALSPWFTTIPTEGAPLEGDGIHFNAAGMVEIGKALAVALTNTPHLDTTAASIKTIGNNVTAGYAGRQATGNYRVMIGDLAGDTSTGTNVIAIGQNALRTNTQNNVIGIGTLTADANTGFDLVALGQNAARNNSGDYVVAVGLGAGQSNAGDSNTLVGYNAGNATTGSNVVAIGPNAGQVSGGNSVFVGRFAGINATTTNVVAVGYNAAVNLSTGGNTVAVGTSALGGTTTQAGNTAVGHSALGTNSGAYCISLGAFAGAHNQSEYATYIGAFSGPQNATDKATFDFDNTVSIGRSAQALKANQIMLGNATYTTSLRTPATEITFGALPSYADDAAADADSAFPSGSLYRVAGGRAVYQKP